MNSYFFAQNHIIQKVTTTPPVDPPVDPPKPEITKENAGNFYYTSWNWNWERLFTGLRNGSLTTQWTSGANIPTSYQASGNIWDGGCPWRWYSSNSLVGGIAGGATAKNNTNIEVEILKDNSDNRESLHEFAYQSIIDNYEFLLSISLENDDSYQEYNKPVNFSFELAFNNGYVKFIAEGDRPYGTVMHTLKVKGSNSNEQSYTWNTSGTQTSYEQGIQISVNDNIKNNPNSRKLVIKRNGSVLTEITHTGNLRDFVDEMSYFNIDAENICIYNLTSILTLLA